MSLTKPSQPLFDVEDWLASPHQTRVRQMCETWAMQGFGAPGIAYIFYVVKMALYIGGFLAFTANTQHLGGLSHFGTWWSSPIAFEKAVIWTLLFEVFGLGCASGPLTGRYIPPVTAFTHWLRPGTTRLAPFPKLPFTAGYRRTPVDVFLFALVVGLSIRALLCDDMTHAILLPIIIVMLVLGLRDKTIFLAARSEHYLLATVVFLFPHDLWAGSKAVQLALWFGAASSKLNYHFPNVIAVMTSNNPFVRSKKVRAALYQDYPTDMRGSALAAAIAHAATVVEYGFPIVLLSTHGGLATDIALAVLVAFHSNILLSFPMGVPLEWNLFFIYSGLVVFGEHASVRLWSLHSPLLIVILVVVALGMPILGNLRPDKISFLPSMRYYAGNWAVSLWLWRPGVLDQLDTHIVKTAKVPRRQIEKLYGPPSYQLIVGRLQAFRSMHLHGRALNALLPLAIADLTDPEVVAKGIDAFEVVDGELVAGVVLGWNFGDGHLHNEQLLDAIQSQCHFAEGELRCIFLESQPALTPTMKWRIVDVVGGQLAAGEVRTKDLLEIQPWGGAVELAEQLTTARRGR